LGRFFLEEWYGTFIRAADCTLSDPRQSKKTKTSRQQLLSKQHAYLVNSFEPEPPPEYDIASRKNRRDSPEGKELKAEDNIRGVRLMVCILWVDLGLRQRRRGN
jgi:hypothetical protein